MSDLDMEIDDELSPLDSAIPDLESEPLIENDTESLSSLELEPNPDMDLATAPDMENEPTLDATIEADTDSEITTFSLEKEMSGDQVETLISGILAHRYNDLMIDASAVERVDTTSLEVLISAAKQWTIDGCKLSFSSISENFQKILATLGFDQSDLETGDLQ